MAESNSLDLFRAYGPFELQVHRSAVGDVNRDPDAGCRDSYIRLVQYLPGLLAHLLLFQGVTGFQEPVYVGNDVIGDLARLAGGLAGIAVLQSPGLFLQAGHQAGPRSGYRLVGVGYNPGLSG